MGFERETDIEFRVIGGEHEEVCGGGVACVLVTFFPLFDSRFTSIFSNQ